MPSPLDRLDRRQPGDLVTPRVAPAVRGPARLADPRPNAPLLIRLVRHPYGLHPGRPVRGRYLPVEAPVEVVDRREQIAAALAERGRVRSTSPVKGRPRPFAVRPTIWALLPPESDPR